MSGESYKAWVDAMPIDDVRERIERFERKLSDLRVLERLYEERNGDRGADPESAPEHGGGEGVGWSTGESAGEHG